MLPPLPPPTSSLRVPLPPPSTPLSPLLFLPSHRAQLTLSRDVDGTLGIDVDLFEGHPTVAILVPDGPAERQGTLQPGDIILKINGTACATIAQVLGPDSPNPNSPDPTHLTLLT